MPTRHYCTLFDRNYLIRGLALYRSLERHEADFELHVLCMDDLTHEILDALGLERARLIRLRDFETPELLAVKADRSVAEYCLTCAPCLMDHVMERHSAIGFLTYLDADLLFFSSTDPVYEEIDGASTVIVEHRFAPRFRPWIVNGKYNVQWVSFRRDPHGLETLRWWRDRCIEWCYYRLEDDRMGDQKYLDCWPERFQGVHELQHVGAGTAPWNFANYRIEERDGAVWVDDVPLIFYHFHGYRMYADGSSDPMPSIYLEDAPLPACIYGRYDRALVEALREVRGVEPSFSHGLLPVEGAGTTTAAAPRAAGAGRRLVRQLLRAVLRR